MQRFKRPAQETTRQGAALVEMAMVLPLFLMLLLGVVEFGRAMMVGQLVTNTAREGCRMATIDGSTNTSVSAYIRGFLKDTLKMNETDVAVTLTVNGVSNGDLATATTRDLILVDVAVPFDKVSYLPASYLSGISLKSRAAMRHE